jgi:tRNA dimethylallyltransferase
VAPDRSDPVTGRSNTPSGGRSFDVEPDAGKGGRGDDDSASPCPPRHVALVGTTASGKSALAFELARDDPTIEIVSVDSMQVYRGMDVGTAKPTIAEQAAVPHHLIDVADPWDQFTVAWFAREARRAVDEIEARGHRALLVGGTGLYLRSVVDDLAVPGLYPEVRAQLDADPDTVRLHRRLVELDPVAANRMEPTNRRRILRALEVTLGSGQPFSSYGPGLEAYPPSRFHLVGVNLPHVVVSERIEARYHRQMAQGFLDEVRRLLAQPRGLSRTARQALGYRELIAHLDGGSNLDESLALAIRRTRRFARRQRSWFRRDPRIRWLASLNDPRSVLPALVAELAIADAVADGTTRTGQPG